MNYRHGFHAGNFADVVKHVILCRLIEYLKRKDKAFRVIDTHAGAGLYDLSGDNAQRTGEWRDGIGRLAAAALPADVAALLSPYLDAVRAAAPGETLTRYPGSPWLSRKLLRKQDRLTAIELHPADSRSLSRLFADDHQVRVLALDGWLALGAHLPPKEKRGLVLVDPPFEEGTEFERLVTGLRKAWRRWPGGIYALWYPLKDETAVRRFRSDLRDAGIPKILDIALVIRPPSLPPRLRGSGLVVVNPPHTLPGELELILPVLQNILAQAPDSVWSATWLAGEAVAP